MTVYLCDIIEHISKLCIMCIMLMNILNAYPVLELNLNKKNIYVFI